MSTRLIFAVIGTALEEAALGAIMLKGLPGLGIDVPLAVTIALMVGWLNRVGGAVFGAVLVGVAVSAALGLWVGNLGMAGAIGASRLALLFLEYFPVISSILPAG